MVTIIDKHPLILPDDDSCSHIFSFLTLEEMFFRVRLVCRNFHEIIVGEGKSNDGDDQQVKKPSMMRNCRLEVSLRYNNPDRLKSLSNCIRKGYFVHSVSKLKITARSANLLETLLDKNDFFLQYFSNLTNLKLEARDLNDQDLSQLFSLENAKYLRKLIKLDLSFNSLTCKTMQMIANCEALSNLTHLYLDNNDVENEGFIQLTQSLYLDNLKLINVEINFLEGSAWSKQFKWKNLERFHISNNEQIGEEAFNLIFNTQSTALFGKLTEIMATDTCLNANAIKYMNRCSATAVPTLSSLYLSYNDLDNDSISLLSQSKCLSKLEKLELIGCGISGQGFSMLTSSDCLSNLKELILESNDINSEGFVHFGTNAYKLKNLRALDLLSNELDLNCFENLLREPSLQTMERLCCDSIKEDVAKYISEHQENLIGLSNLMFSSYSEPNSNDDSFEYIGKLKLPNLKSLKCTGTGGSLSGILSFMENCSMGNLETLEIGKVYTKEADAFVKVIGLLVSNPHFSNLSNFSMDYLKSDALNLLLNSMDEGKTLSNLTALSVSSISDTELDALVSHPNTSKLKMLALMEGDLSDQAIEKFVNSPYLHNLFYLDLINTSISRRASEMIFQCKNMPNLEQLFGNFDKDHYCTETHLPKLHYVHYSEAISSQSAVESDDLEHVDVGDSD